MLIHWLIVLLAVTKALTRPNELKNSRDEPISYSDVITTTEKQSEDKTENVDEIEKIATVARASNSELSLAPGIVKGAEEVLHNIEQMVDKDTRTPPKLQEILKDTKNVSTNESKSLVDKIEANGKFELASDPSEGKASKKGDGLKGVAVPVIMDEDLDTTTKKLQKIPNPPKPKEDKKKPTTVKPIKEVQTTTTPSSGLSTWILLSDNKEATTPSTKSSKKSVTTKKPKVTTTTAKPSTSKSSNNKKNVLKTEQKKTETVLETMVKSQKKPTKNKIKENAESKTESPVLLTTTQVTIDITEKEDGSSTETSLESTTKRKNSTKKRKKNKKKKPVAKDESNQEVKDVAKQPVGAQFYNFLSREIMPTVGIGLVGVLVTAGLAGLLGYNPFVNSNLPIRRTYENQHGYTPNNYYSYSSPEYGEGDGGQAEEVLFREVLSGMPDNSRYGLTNGDKRYSEDQYYHKSDQTSEKPEPSYSSVYGYDYQKDKYPIYSDSGYVYPDSSTTSEKYHASMKVSNDGKIEKQPEAIYQVSGMEEDSHSWHRIGSSMEQSHVSAPEPGPRRLNLDEMTKTITQNHKVVKRSTLPENDDFENEIDGYLDANQIDNHPTPTNTIDTTTESTSEPIATTIESITVNSTVKTIETTVASETTEMNTTEAPSLMEVLKKVANFKFRLGISVLKTTADAFSRYLDGVLRRVEDGMINETRERNDWFSERFRRNMDEARIREKRYRRDLYDKKPKLESKKNIKYKTKHYKLKNKNY